MCRVVNNDPLGQESKERLLPNLLLYSIMNKGMDEDVAVQSRLLASHVENVQQCTVPCLDSIHASSSGPDTLHKAKLQYRTRRYNTGQLEGQQLTCRPFEGAIDYTVTGKNDRRDAQTRKRPPVAAGQHGVPSPVILPSEHHGSNTNLHYPFQIPSSCLAVPRLPYGPQTCARLTA